MTGGFLAVVLAAAVCVSAAAAAPTKAEFIRKGDAVCTQTKRELVPIRKRAEAEKLLPQSEQWSATADIYADQIVIQKRFVRRFKAIGVPADDAAATALVARLDKGVVLALRIQREFATHDVAALETALPAYVRFTVETDRRMVAYGFHSCGR